MSILDLILGHQIILILIGIALAMLLAALLITLKNHLQTLSAKRAEHRAERAHALALAIAAEVESGVEKVRPAVTTKAVVKPPLPISAPTLAAPAAGAIEVPTNSEAIAIDTISGAMQDILSSVFGDEESTSHPEALLDDLKEIEATDLLTLANRLVAQLDTTAIKGKEL